MGNRPTKKILTKLPQRKRRLKKTKTPREKSRGEFVLHKNGWGRYENTDINAYQEWRRMNENKQTKKELFWEIVRFLLVGATATLVDYIVFWIFDALLFPLVFPVENAVWTTVALVLSTALGFCVGLLVNWVLSVRFVFRAVRNGNKVRSKKGFALFALIGVIGLGITELGILLLVWIFPEIELFGSLAFLGTAWEKWIAKAIMTVTVLVWNYLGRKLFVFRP